MLKPSLARGLQISGATTLNEYRQTIEKDAALTRRFQVRLSLSRFRTLASDRLLRTPLTSHSPLQPVMVEEPSVEQAVTMLRGLKPKLEVHHGGELLSFREGWCGVTLLILAALLHSHDL